MLLVAMQASPCFVNLQAFLAALLVQLGLVVQALIDAVVFVLVSVLKL